MSHSGAYGNPRYIRPDAPVRRSRQCRGKRQWPKRKQALTAMNQQRAANPDDSRELGIYKCRECGFFHVGHTTPRRTA